MATKRAEKSPSEECKSLRHLLLYARARRGWQQSQVVKHFGTTATTYKSWERGARPRAEWFVPIAKFCNVPLERVVILATAEQT